MLKINGVDFDFDLSDINNLNYYRKCLNALEKCCEYSSKLAGKEKYVYECESAIIFINAVLGDGADKKIFKKGIATLNECMDVLDIIAKESERQRKNFKGIILKVDFKSNI